MMAKTRRKGLNVRGLPRLSLAQTRRMIDARLKSMIDEVLPESRQFVWNRG
jgi:hypothetical protein